MSITDLDKLFKSDKKELNKISKSELVESIIKNAWYWQHQREQVEKLNDQLKLSKAPYDQAKLMLIGATGYAVDIDEYSKKPNLESVDLCFLIGLLLSKRDSQ